MRFFQFRRFLCALLLCFALSSAALAQTSSSIGSIFNNKGELGIESVRNTAQSQSTATPYYKSNSVENRTYEGYFKAASSDTKLALLSDDGSSVWINGQQVLSSAGQNQGFENFDSAFTPLSQSFAAGKIYHLKVEYTNTIHSGDSDVDGVSLWAYDGGGEMVSLSVTATITDNETAICAGGIADDVHRAEIVATVKDSGGVAVPNIPVTFTVANSNSQYPASLTESSATTDAQGKAKTKLTSSRKINATATVTAKISGGEAATPSITMEYVEDKWDISAEELPANGEAQASIEVELTYNQQKVQGHEVSWRIYRIWNEDNVTVYEDDPRQGSAEGYGSLAAGVSTSGNDGIISATYTAGTQSGIIEFVALDNTVVANSPAKLLDGSGKVKTNFYLVYTYVNGGKVAQSKGERVGTRNSMQFYVTLNAIVKRGIGEAPLPNSINFVHKRFQNGAAKAEGSGTVQGQLDSTPTSTPNPAFQNWEYWSRAPVPPNQQSGGWNITRLRGKWQISVDFPANNYPLGQVPAYFKIDKRDQIVTLARSWIGGTAAQLEAVMPTSICGSFTSMIYEQLGLNTSPLPYVTIPRGTDAQHTYMGISDPGNGAILFYRSNLGATRAGWDAAHTAIRDGQSRININSNTKPLPEYPISSESITAGVKPLTPPMPQDDQDLYFDYHYRSSVDLDED